MTLTDALSHVLKYDVDPSHRTFHEAIHEGRNGDVDHLVYADWLQEQDHDDAANHIRKAVARGKVWVRPVSDVGGALRDVTDTTPRLVSRWRGVGDDGGPQMMEAYAALSAHDPTHLLHWVAPAEEEPEHYRTNAVRYTTLADEGDFHRAIRTAPDADIGHLGYADWLRENDREGEGDFIAESRGPRGAAAEKPKFPIKGPIVQVTRNRDHDLVTLSHLDRDDGKTVHSWSLRSDPGHTADRLGALVRSGVTPTGPTATRMHLDHGAAKVGLDEFRLSDHLDVPERPGGNEMPVQLYGADETPVRYKAVAEHDIHEDYGRYGIAPRVGVLLNRIAAEDSDAGALAEGILRTGDHSLLKILGDKLADDGHDLRSHTDGGTGPDWRHTERGLSIDRAVHEMLPTLYREMNRREGLPGLTIRTPFDVSEPWTRGKRGVIGRQKMVSDIQKAVPDANREDVHHSLSRLWANHPNLHTEEFPEWAAEVVNGRLKELKSTVPDAHLYPDTRPPGKRVYAAEKLFRSPSGGMVVKESPLAVVGQYRPGGTYTGMPDTAPTPEPTPTPRPSLRTLLKRLRKRK